MSLWRRFVYCFYGHDWDYRNDGENYWKVCRRCGDRVDFETIVL